MKIMGKRDMGKGGDNEKKEREGRVD